MSYLKLCQIINQSETTIFYQEDCDGKIIVSTSISYPITFQCEVIDWESEEEFLKRGKANSFASVNVTIQEQPPEIREAVYQQLIASYPNLIK